MITGTTRLEAFSDGVFAIIITSMILELKIPDLTQDNPTMQSINHIRHLLPYFVTYAFSFIMIGIFWTNHHHMFHLLEHADMRLVWQNWVFLFLLSLIPSATGIVGANPDTTLSPVSYGLVMLLTNLSFLIRRHYNLRRRLVQKDRDQTLSDTIVAVFHKGRREPKPFWGRAFI